MALFRRLFYRKPPDRLLEISDRVYVFDCCFSTDVLAEDAYKEYMGGVVTQLQDYYPEASFMVFNFREGESRTQISDILSQYDMTVMEYPRQYENCPLLPLEMIYHFLRSSESWLSLEGQQNVILMHCEKGGWPVLAFMLAGLLLYKKQYTGEQKTLEMIYKQAPKELLRVLSPLNPQPSHTRYLQYISRRIIGSDLPPQDRLLVVDCFVLKVLPLFDGEKGCPVVRIYGQDPSSNLTRNSKLLFSSANNKDHIPDSNQMRAIKLDVHCPVQGDIVIECVHLSYNKEEMVFRCMFHTSFVRSNILHLTRDDVDILWDAKDRFSGDFKAEVHFTDDDDELDPDAAHEEFFEVAEVFSNAIDGAEGKGEFDPHAYEDCASEEGSQKQDTFAELDINAVQDIALDDINKKQSITSKLDADVVKDIVVDDGSQKLERSAADMKDISLDQAIGIESIKLVVADALRREITKSTTTAVHSPVESVNKKHEQEYTTQQRSQSRSPPRKPSADVITQQRSHSRSPTRKSSTDVIKPRSKKPPTFSQKSAPDSASSKNRTKTQDSQSDPTKPTKQKPTELRWIPSNKGSFTNSMHVAYPHMKIIVPPPVPPKKDQVKEPNLGGRKSRASSVEVGALNDYRREHTNKEVKGLRRSESAKQMSVAGESESSSDSCDVASPMDNTSTVSSQAIPPKEVVIKSPPPPPPLPPSPAPVVVNRQTRVPPPPPPPPPLPQIHHSITSTENLLPSSPQCSLPPPPSSPPTPAAVLRQTRVPPPPPPPPQIHHSITLTENLLPSPPQCSLPPPPPPPPPTPVLLQQMRVPPPPPLLPQIHHSITLTENLLPSPPQCSVPLPPPPPPPPPTPPLRYGQLASLPLHPPPLTSPLGHGQRLSIPPPPPPPPFSRQGATHVHVTQPLPHPTNGGPPPPLPLLVFETQSPRGQVLSPPPPTPPPLQIGGQFIPPSPFSGGQGPPPPPPPPPGILGSPPPPLSPGSSGLPPPSPPPPPPPPSGGQGPPHPPTPPPGAQGPSPPPPPPPPGGGAPPPPPSPGGLGPPPPPPPGVLGPPTPPSPGGVQAPPPPPSFGVPGPPAPPGGAPPPPGDLKSLGKGRLARSSALATAPRRQSLKPLHWSKVTRVLKGSLWEELQKQAKPQCEPDIDVSEVETLFSTIVAKPSKSSGQKKSTPKSETIHLVDLRRANNTEIMLTKVKMPLSDMMAAALALDETVLDADQVENLIKFCPTKEEMDLLQNYPGDKEKLGKCEQFFMELMKVPRVEAKLRVFLFKIQFNAQILDFERSLNLVHSACNEVRNSTKLKEVMRIILALGNTLNNGTARGGACGFKLDSLLKLNETRATNSRMTLMHYLAKVLYKKYPELLDFHEDCVSIEAASKIQLKALAEEMQAITKGLEKVKEELAASESDGPVSETFCKTLKAYIGSAESDVASVMKLYSKAGASADALAQYFGEDPARCPFEQVTQTLLNFVKSIRTAHEENLKQEELEKKRAEKEAEIEKSKEASTSKSEEPETETTKEGSTSKSEEDETFLT